MKDSSTAMCSIRKYMKTEFEKLGFHVTNKELDAFSTYLNELKKWNDKFNITALKKEEVIVKRLFLSSSMFSKLLQGSTGLELLDIGTGGGFPGIPLKIFNPDLNITLLDSSQKKISFVKNICRVLGCSKIRSIAKRAEEFAKETGERERYDFVVAHSVATLHHLTQWAYPFLKPGGCLITRKGDTYEAEIQEALAKNSGFVLHKILPVPDIEENPYYLVAIKKQ